MICLVQTDTAAVMFLPSLDRVQLHTKFGGVWEVGHGKDIPAGMSPGVAAEYMVAFMSGDLTHEQYNEALP